MNKFNLPDWLVCLALHLPDPAISNDNNGRHILYCWDKWEHHLEVELSDYRYVDFFYRNRLTKGIWMESWDAKSGLPIPIEVVFKFEFMREVFDCD